MADPVMSHLAGVDQAQEAAAEAFVLRTLRAAGGAPMRPDDLFEAGRHQANLSYSVLRLVLWTLVGKGLVELTKDWRVKLA